VSVVNPQAAAVFALDELSVKPGSLDEMRRRIVDEYAPRVRAVGLTLRDLFMDPAVELRDRPTDLLVLWEVEGGEFWKMRLGAARDPEIAAFWTEVEPLLAGRRWRLMVRPDDPQVMR
jgi:hypothetical protein